MSFWSDAEGDKVRGVISLIWSGGSGWWCVVCRRMSSRGSVRVFFFAVPGISIHPAGSKIWTGMCRGLYLDDDRRQLTRNICEERLSSLYLSADEHQAGVKRACCPQVPRMTAVRCISAAPHEPRAENAPPVWPGLPTFACLGSPPVAVRQLLAPFLPPRAVSSSPSSCSFFSHARTRKWG